MGSRSRISRRTVLIGTLGFGFGTSAGCASNASEDQSRGVLDGSTDAIVKEYDVRDRVKVSNFEARLLDGSTVAGAQLDGVISVVNVWGSWCGPCRAEAPVLRSVSNAYRDRGVQFLGLNVRDNPAAASAFERRFEIPYPSVHPDDAARVSLAFGGKLTTTAVPTTVIVDRSRRIASRVVGEVSRPTLEALVQAALAP